MVNKLKQFHLLFIVAMTVALASCGKDFSSTESSGSGIYFYVASTSAIDHIEVDATTGVPRLVNSYATIAANNRAIAISHNNKFLYVSSQEGYLQYYSIDSNDGSLVPWNVEVVGSDIFDIKMHPSENYLYVADRGATNGVRIYDVNSTTGSITERFSIAASGSSNASYLAFSNESTTDPKFVFLTNSGANSISVFEIDQTNGATDGQLTFRETSISSLDPAQMVLYTDLSSTTHVYQSGLDNSNLVGATTDLISKVTFTDDGSTWLSAWGATPSEYVIIENTPVAVRLDSTNNRILALNFASDNISILNINTTNGALTEDASSPVLLPDGNATTPVRGPSAGLIFGNYLYVTEFTSNSITMLNLSDLSAVDGGTQVSTSTSPYAMSEIVSFN